MPVDDNLGISGRIARQFQNNAITPLLALLAVLMGLFAIMMTPREEEPQIDVTFANVLIAFPGASAEEVENLIAIPAQQVLSELNGVDHLFAVSKPGMAVITVQFEVGEQRNEAIVRLYNQIYSNNDWLPTQLGVAQPIIKPMGIDDVPIVSLTLWSENPDIDAYQLQQVSHSLETELKRIKGTRDIYTIGGSGNVVRIELNPIAMAAYQVDPLRLKMALQQASHSAEAGIVIQQDQASSVQAGEFLSNVETVEQLVITVHQGKPVYLKQIANIQLGAAQTKQFSWIGFGTADKQTAEAHYPSVTLAIAKQPGTNAVDIADAVLQRVTDLSPVMIPAEVNITFTRNYGQTADDKAQTLIHKLIFVTLAVVVLVWMALGWREAIIVGIAVVITLMLTLFASWVWGFTLNRVSLFALIFAIGILVDDAIVVVENIHRHLQTGQKTFAEAIPLAVDEVGSPTIMATLAVIAALLPMAFVSGLMGPYMSPIPINASIGMLLSLLVAFMLTPWLVMKILPAHGTHQAETRSNHLAEKILSPFIRSSNSKRWRQGLFLSLMGLIVLSVGLVVVKLVVLKMLPFDNKSEFQLVIDLPEGSPVERTAAAVQEFTQVLNTLPELRNYQAYVGSAGPMTFNGLVRQYYLREESHLADIQVNLLDKKDRDRSSHEIASTIRPALQTVAKRWDASLKVVELPPGPPVQAPIVAEIYAADFTLQQDFARQLVERFSNTPGLVDIDSTLEADMPRWLMRIDREKAALLGISQQQIVDVSRILLSGEDVAYLHNNSVKYPVPLRLQFPISSQRDLTDLLQLPISSTDSANNIPLGEMVSLEKTAHQQTRYQKDLLPVVYVTADMAGDMDSPLYGMFDVVFQLLDMQVPQSFIQQPDLPLQPTVKWDGEWQVTYETFRDMGAAYAVGIVLIYLLLVAQFKSYLLPLVIMVPIPLTIIGVMPGHALLGAQFTATSMIGMIAMAGIIVRNSILLVDFIHQSLDQRMSLQDAVIEAVTVRAKPIILTAAAAILGAIFILDDPIFNGLAVALLFGILVSTILTLLVIPVLFYSLYQRRYQ